MERADRNLKLSILQSRSQNARASVMQKARSSSTNVTSNKSSRCRELSRTI